MSRAFVKELDDQAESALPERPQSLHTNYITPEGFLNLQEQVRNYSQQHKELASKDDLAGIQQLRQIERDLHYYQERVRRAVVVNSDGQPQDKVHFGSIVEVEDETGQRNQLTIVGEDESNAAAGKISWVSPLASALLDCEVGETVIWRRPAGDKQLIIIAIHQS